MDNKTIMPAFRLDPRNYGIAGVVIGGNKQVATEAGVNVANNAVATGTTTTGSATLSAAETIARLYTNTTTGALALTTLTAAQIVAALKPLANNTSFVWTLKNPGSNTITLTAGTGITISGDATVATGQICNYLVVVTNNVPGSEAVTYYSLGNSVTA